MTVPFTLNQYNGETGVYQTMRTRTYILLVVALLTASCSSKEDLSDENLMDAVASEIRPIACEKFGTDEQVEPTKGPNASTPPIRFRLR